jgi:hypothetical protein
LEIYTGDLVYENIAKNYKNGMSDTAYLQGKNKRALLEDGSCNYCKIKDINEKGQIAEQVKNTIKGYFINPNN